MISFLELIIQCDINVFAQSFLVEPVDAKEVGNVYTSAVVTLHVPASPDSPWQVINTTAGEPWVTLASNS